MVGIWRFGVRYKFLLALIIGYMFINGATKSYAGGWLIYSKPEFKGKVIDAETKEPIEGAVVVAVYSKQAIRIAPESVGITINVKETLTDKNGNFHIPSYTTIIDPFSWSKEVTLIIFKPSYGSFPHGRVYPPKGMETRYEEFFSGEIGEVKEVWITEPWKVGADHKKEKVTFGIVELPQLKTREERLKAKNSADIFGADFSTKELPLLYKAISEENKNLVIQ